MTKPSTPWRVRQYPNGEPWIEDADGYVVTQVVSSIRYFKGDQYDVRNREHAEAICAAVNAMFPPQARAAINKATH